MGLIPRRDLSKYFVIAVKQIELRGFVWADSRHDAMKRARDNWYISDEKGGVIVSGTANTSYGVQPIISETDKAIKIIHVENADMDKKVMGISCPVCSAKPGGLCRKQVGIGLMSGFHLERMMKVIDLNDRVKKVVKGTKWD